LAHQHKASAQQQRQRRAKNKAARLHPHHLLNARVLERLGQALQSCAEGARILKQRRNVPEQNARRGEFGNIPNNALQPVRALLVGEGHTRINSISHTKNSLSSAGTLSQRASVEEKRCSIRWPGAALEAAHIIAPACQGSMARLPVYLIGTTLLGVYLCA